MTAFIAVSQDPTNAEAERLETLVQSVDPLLTLTRDGPWQDPIPIAAIAAGLALAVALIAVALTLGLAAADARPDLSTLAAVGAPTWIRRRIAAAQAALIAGTGTLVGAAIGIPIGLVLSLWGRESGGWGVLWPLNVPWSVPVSAVLIPLVAMGGAWLLTRSRLPMARRLTE